MNTQFTPKELARQITETSVFESNHQAPKPYAKSQCFFTKDTIDPEERYRVDYSFKSADPKDPSSVHTTAELLQYLESNPEVELESRVLGLSEDGIVTKRMDATQFKESFKNKTLNEKGYQKLREYDTFGRDAFNAGYNNEIGQDFTPLLGGPFFKNQYYYQDYIRMHSDAFYAYHYDPVAKAFISITRDFVLGTGFEVQCDLDQENGKLAMAVWKAFEEVNDLHQQMDDACTELSIYGENLFWWLPNNETKIVYDLPDAEIPRGIIPRVRLLDPSNMIEIVTYPEDITRKLFYVWLTPTQYQIYTSSMASPKDSTQPIQPTLKFIYQQIPADQILHFKVNSVSNEKRGRSDLFPIFSYLKRFRDSVNYSLIALQKVSAWAMDTTIDGNQVDIDAYIQNQGQLPTIPFAGSEFVHSKAITREYLGNSNAGGNMSDAQLFALSACCMGVQIPFNYLGTHLSSGTTQASALVSTEPVAKKMEKRREVIKRVLKDLWKKLMKETGIPGLDLIDCNIIFPEIITQDRSQKLQDLSFGQQNGWWSEERVASTAAKEMGFSDYNYNEEKEKMSAEGPPASATAPLSTPGQYPPLPKESQVGKPIQQAGGPKLTDTASVSPKPPMKAPLAQTAALTSQDKKGIKQNDASY